MNTALEILAAKKHFEAKEYAEALALYTKILHFYMYGMMYQISDTTVQGMQENRFRCYRAMREIRNGRN